jgi:DNA-binding sugar fermentation-stimulating protein
VRGRKILMEVKGSTLEIDGVGYFSRTRRRSGA